MNGYLLLATFGLSTCPQLAELIRNLPGTQVFFGKDLIGGWEDIDSMSTVELQSYFLQFLEQSQVQAFSG